MAGRPSGTANKHKPFRAALNRAIDEAGPNPRAMDEIAQALLTAARGGDIQAIREVADRLDGKVPQAVVGSDEDPAVRVDNRIELVIIDPKEDGNV